MVVIRLIYTFINNTKCLLEKVEKIPGYTQPSYNLGPLSAHQRNPIWMAGVPFVASFYMLTVVAISYKKIVG